MNIRSHIAELIQSRSAVNATVIVLVGLFVLLLGTVAPGLLSGWEERGGDGVWELRAAAAPADEEERRFVIVDIDEASIAKVGPWPWPRERMAELSRRLSALGVNLQIYDVVLPEQRADDANLASELAKRPTILAQIFSMDPGTPVAVGKLQGALASGAPRCGSPLPQAAGYIANTGGLASVPGLAAGHITPRIAQDGAVRHIAPVICFEGRAYPSLGLAAVAKAAGVEPAWSLTKGGDWWGPAWQLTHPALPGIVVPLDGNGDARLSYRLPRRALISVSAADVLAGTAPDTLFRGAWALIGATAFGIGDAVPTPHGGAVAGVEVNAQFISALLDARLPSTPRAAPVLLLVLTAAGAGVLLLALRWRRLPAIGLPLVGAMLALAFFGLHAWLQIAHDVWLGWAVPALFAFVGGVLLAAAEYARARFERERLYGNLTSYLPEPVAAEIAFREPTGIIDAQRREVTVLFADIRNFSAYCEGRPPEEAAALLHAFFTTATRVIEAHGGLVEEFVGDAVLAIWNAPEPCADHPAKALAAAQELQNETAPLFEQPPPAGLEPLALGIGIETGNALVGSFGPARRRTHTVLGETVTVAVRLQGLTVDLAQPIVLGEQVAKRLPADAVISLGSFLLEGLRTARDVYAPSSSERTLGRREGRATTRPRLISGLRKS